MAERQDIVEGLKNALERGYSIDIAVSSFINAGYNRQDVEDSAKSFGGVFLQPSFKPSPQIIPKTIQPPQSPQSQVNVPQPTQPTQPPQQMPPIPSPQQYKQPQQPPQQFQQVQQPQQNQLAQFPQQTQSQSQSSQSESRSGNVLESKNIIVNAQNVSVQTKPEKKGWGMIIFLIAILLILLGGLFALVFAREQVISLLAEIGITF